jgi:hypothetical protein
MYFLQIKLNLWHAHQRRQIFKDGGSIAWDCALVYNKKSQAGSSKPVIIVRIMSDRGQSTVMGLAYIIVIYRPNVDIYDIISG